MKPRAHVSRVQTDYVTTILQVFHQILQLPHQKFEITYADYNSATFTFGHEFVAYEDGTLKKHWTETSIRIETESVPVEDESGE